MTSHDCAAQRRVCTPSVTENLCNGRSWRRSKPSRACDEHATNSRDRKPYVYIRYTNRSAWPYMRGTCRIRCSRDPQNRGFRETVTGWLVPIRLGPRASTACAIYIPTSSNIPCMHTSTTARARSSGPPERAYAHAAREH